MLKKRTLALLLESLLFLFASLTTFYAFYVLMADMQDFSHFFKMLPLYLSFASIIYVCFIFHLILHPISYSRLKKTYEINALVLASIALLSAVLFLINVLTGSIHGFIQGVLSPLYPLDFFILDLINIALGVYLFVTGRKLREEDAVYEPYPYGKLRKVFASFFRSLFVLIALYLIGAFLWGLGMANYGSAYQGYMIVVYLLMLLPSFFLGFYEWYYRDAKSKLTDKKKKLYAWLSFAISVFLTILFEIFINLHTDLLIEEATAYFPLDFQGSMALAPFLLTIPSLAASTCAVIHAYPSKKAK